MLSSPRSRRLARPPSPASLPPLLSPRYLPTSDRAPKNPLAARSCVSDGAGAASDSHSRQREECLARRQRASSPHPHHRFGFFFFFFSLSRFLSSTSVGFFLFFFSSCLKKEEGKVAAFRDDELGRGEGLWCGDVSTFSLRLTDTPTPGRGRGRETKRPARSARGPPRLTIFDHLFSCFCVIYPQK